VSAPEALQRPVPNAGPVVPAVPGTPATGALGTAAADSEYLDEHGLRIDGDPDLVVILVELRELRAVVDELANHSRTNAHLLARVLTSPRVRRFLGL